MLIFCVSAFMKRIIGARQEEISFAKKYQFVAAVQGVFWNTTPGNSGTMILAKSVCMDARN